MAEPKLNFFFTLNYINRNLLVNIFFLRSKLNCIAFRNGSIPNIGKLYTAVVVLLITVKLNANNSDFVFTIRGKKESEKMASFFFFCISVQTSIKQPLAILVKVSTVIKATFFC